MKKSVLVLIFLLIPIVYSQELYQSQELEMQATISSEFEIIPTSSSYDIDYISVELYFFPKGDFQSTVLTQDIKPEAKEITDDYIKYQWDSPDAEEKLEFTLTSKIITKNEFKKVKNKQVFPIDAMLIKLAEYTQSTETVDSENEEIIKQASEIVQGTDDLYEAVFELGKWTENNIEYSLNSLTTDVSQKASWVLMSRYGVCDELTTLFIAMCRSLGIPARFISGLAYTNYNNLNDWGPHAWAEVWFPDVGWVPFDITYGEFGFVDPSHIILKYSLDPSESSNKYEWRGRNIELETHPLDFEVGLKELTGKAAPRIQITTSLLYDSIGFGSYNLVEAEIENLKDHYLAVQLQIATSNEVEVIGRDKQQILLKPDEVKKIFWKIKLSENLDRNYIYTLPVAVYSVTNITSQTSFTSIAKETVYSSEHIDEIIDSYSTDEKIYSTEISLECDADKKAIATTESIDINCIIKNQGNILLEDIDICLYDDCKNIDLGISQKQKIVFTYSSDEPGKRTVSIKADNDQVSKSDSIILEIFDAPELLIANINYPSEIEFNDEYQLEFDLQKESYADASDINVKVIQNNRIDVFEIDAIETSQKIKLNLLGKNLKKGINDIRIIVEYKDDKGNQYSAQEQIQINLINVSFSESIQIWLHSLNNWLESLFN